MSAFGDDLQRWLDGYPILWQRPGWMMRQRLEMKRNPKMWGLKAAVWLLLVLSVGTTAAAVGFQNVAKSQSEIAIRKEQLLEKSDQNRVRAQKNEAIAEQLAADRESFAREQERLKEHWEAESRQLAEFRDYVVPKMEKLEQRRENLLARVNLARENQDILGAMLNLMVLGDDLTDENFTDIELIQWFIDQLNTLFEMAKQDRLTDETH